MKIVTILLLFSIPLFCISQNRTTFEYYQPPTQNGVINPNPHGYVDLDVEGCGTWRKIKDSISPWENIDTIKFNPNGGTNWRIDDWNDENRIDEYLETVYYPCGKTQVKQSIKIEYQNKEFFREDGVLKITNISPKKNQVLKY